MADQLLSQADVDALVSSLVRSEPAKAPAPAAKAPAPVVKQEPAPQAVQKSPATVQPPVQKPIKPAQPEAMSSTVEVKPGNSADSISLLNARVAELTNGMVQMSAALKRIENLERKVLALETGTAQNTGASTAQQIQRVSEALKRITNNLKGTPGYGARNSFTCEKCKDHGHIAVKYRCTKCGQEKWYGWWPEK